MADNTDEEHFDSSAAIQAENASKGITPVNSPQAIPQNQATETMEVHKHPHHVMHKKKWSEYLLEFFMLFLAVFLGFFAENIREGQVEKNREHEYIESLVNDLKKDTANAQIVIADFQRFSPFVDSTTTSFPSMISGDTAAIKVYVRNRNKFETFEDFHIMDATMLQLKNSGSLRLIRNKKVVDSILAYDNLSKDALQQEDWIDKLFEKYWEHRAGCIDDLKIYAVFKKLSAGLKPGEKLKIADLWKIWSPQNILATTDRPKLNSYYASLGNLNSNCKGWIDYLKDFKQHGTRLITFLQKEYHLENE